MAISKIPSAGFQDNVKFRNLIINGDMSIAQRSTSVSGITGTGYNTVDRFKNIISGLGTWTASQSTDVPTGQGFAKSLKMDCTTADASPASGDFNLVAQIFEGQMLQYLNKGRSTAKSLTLSFWVKATKTGTNICELYDADNARQISKSYTINSADTWEKKTITFPGDTSGGLSNDNAESLQLHFFLGAGSDRTSGTLSTTWTSFTAVNRAVGQVNHADSTDNEWYITGVQLEAGETASDFEFLPRGVMESLCQRYYFSTTTTIAGYVTGANQSAGCISIFAHPTTMRANPTVTLTYNNGTNYSNYNTRNRDEINTSLNIKGNASGRIFAEFNPVTFEAEL